MSDSDQERGPRGVPIPPDGPVAVFDSIHAVLAAERAFMAACVACDLVPTPRGLGTDCGMALLFRAADLDAARVLLSGAALADRLRGVFLRGPSGYHPAASAAAGHSSTEDHSSTAGHSPTAGTGPADDTGPSAGAGVRSGLPGSPA